MTPASPAPPPVSAPHPIGLRLALAIVALVEAWLGLSDMPVLFGDMSHIADGLGGGLIKANLALHPVLAMAALAFAAMGRVRHAIVALGTVIIMVWLSDMPSIVAHGFDLRGAFSAVETMTRIVAFPLLAACAIAYAAHDEHLGRATFLVAVPALFNIVLVVGFIVSVMKHGF